MNEELKENYIREGYLKAAMDIINVIIKYNRIDFNDTDYLIEEIVKLCKN